MLSQTVDAMIEKIGDAVQQLRLHRNLTQQTLADRSGISVKAVRNLEGGTGISLKSFLAMMRTLDKLDWIETLPPPMGGLSPIEMMKHLDRPVRHRASPVRPRGKAHG